MRLFRLSAFESVHHLAAAERLISTSDLAAVCHPTVARWHGACCLLYCLVIFAATRRRLHVVIFYRRRPLAALSLFAVSALYYSVLLVVTPMLGGLAALFTTLLSVPTTMTIYALSGFPWYGHLVWWALLLALLAGPRRGAAGHLATAAFCALLFLAMLRCCDSPQPASQIASGWLAHHQPPRSISHLTPLRQRGPAAPDTLSSGFQWTPAAVPAAGVILWSSWCLVLWLSTSTPRTPRR